MVSDSTPPASAADVRDFYDGTSIRVSPESEELGER